MICLRQFIFCDFNDWPNRGRYDACVMNIGTCLCDSPPSTAKYSFTKLTFLARPRADFNVNTFSKLISVGVTTFARNIFLEEMQDVFSCLGDAIENVLLTLSRDQTLRIENNDLI